MGKEETYAAVGATQADMKLSCALLGWRQRQILQY
jgi:hypothetical protein